MSDLIWQGLTISVMGMGLTFFALGLLILAMIVLERLFRTSPAGPETAAPEKEPAAGRPAQPSEEEEVVAAIAAALVHLRSLDICRSNLGSTLEAGPGAWWIRGQARQLSVGTSRMAQWRN